MKAKPFFLGVTTGIIGGALATLLTTPQAGKDVRKNISNLSASTKEQIGEMNIRAQNVKQSFLTLSSEVKNNIPQIIKELSQSLSSFKQQIEPETALLKQEIESLQKSINEIEQNLPQLKEKEPQQK